MPQTEQLPWYKHNPYTWKSNWWWIDYQISVRCDIRHEETQQELRRLKREIHHIFDQLLVDIAQRKAEALGGRVIRIQSRRFHG